MKTIYFDYAAATPMDDLVVKVMEPYFSDTFYNPSATYLAAQSVKRDIEAARAKIASILGAKPNNIVFTAGGTEANNLAINGVMEAFPDSNLVVSGIEHESVIQPAKGYKHKTVKVLPDGSIDLTDLTTKIDDRTVLVSIMYANNEIGTIEPIAQIAKIIAEVRKRRQANGNNRPIYLHTDACQAAAYLDLHVSRLGVDMMTINGGKIYGPKQSGFLYVRAGVKLKPQILGGGQERGLRSGTENVASIIGLAKALELVQNRRKQEAARLAMLQQEFIDQAKAIGAKLNGPANHRLPNNVHLTLDGQDNERLLIELETRGIICAAGSACSASNDEPSHVLKAIGLSDKEARSSLRFSMGKATTKADIQAVIKALKLLI